MTPEARRGIEPIKAAVLASFFDQSPEEQNQLRLEFVEAAAAGGFRDIVPNEINCCQTVSRFVLMVLGEDPDILAVGRYFGAGIARMGQVCGALSGAAMALGIRDYAQSRGWTTATRSPEAEGVQRMFSDFADTFGGVTCKELTGVDVSTLDGYNRFRQDNMNVRCKDYVAWAMDRVYELL